MFWNGETPLAMVWGVDFMRTYSITSKHRWYLMMVLQARVFMQLGEWTDFRAGCRCSSSPRLA